MAEDINITLTLDGGENEYSEEPTATAPEMNNEMNVKNAISPSPQSKSSAKAGAKAAVGLMVAKQSLSYATSNVGKFTGDSVLQQQVNLANKAVGYGIAIAMNPALGIAALSIGLATSAIDYSYKRKWESKKEAQLQQRSGNSQFRKSR